MATQVGHQHAKIDTRSAEPALERLADQLLIGIHLGHLGEACVGIEDFAGGIGDDQAVGRCFDRFEDGALCRGAFAAFR